MAKDGYLVIGCGYQRLFEVFCNQLLHKPELITDERFLDVPLRVKNNKAFKVYVEEWLKDIPVSEAVDMILGVGIPAGPIMDLEQISHDPHIAGARKMFTEIEHPTAGTMKLNSNPIKLSETPAKIRSAPPTLGQHNYEIFHDELGLSDKDFTDYKIKGVF